MSLTARADPQQQVKNSRGHLVTFFKNGDSDFPGLRAAVNKKDFPVFATLLDWLQRKLLITSGVRYIFQLPDGKEVTKMEEIHDGRSYVVSSKRSVRRVPYGDSRERFWSNRAPSAGKFRRGEHDLLVELRGKRAHSYPGSRASLHSVRGQVGFQTSLDVRPRVLNIISNTHRNSREKVILNPQTTQSYEEMLQDITSMLRLQNPPVQHLWTTRKPYQQVRGFSHLLRSLKGYDSYYACGSEGVPFEVSNLNNGLQPEYYEEPTPRKNKRKPKPTPRDYEDFEDNRPPPQPKPAFAPRPQSPSTSYAPHGAPHRDIALSPIPITEVNGHHNGNDDEKSNRYEEEPPIDTKKQKDKPFRKPQPDAEVVKVDIHGNPREFYAPRFSQTEPDGSRPDRKLALDWVYGYRGRDARNNLHVLRTGEMVYYVASVAVIYDRKQERQRLYTEHTEDISCLCLHPDTKKPVIATGQTAGKTPEAQAHVRIWDARTLATYAVIGTGFFQNGVSSLSFSNLSSSLQEGELLMCIDEGDKHVLSVWRWQSNKMIGKTTTTTDTVVWGCFHPQDHTDLITYGKQHIYFWKLFWEPLQDEQGRILRDKKSGVFEDEIPKFVTSLVFTGNGDVVSGDSNGRIMVWTKDHQNAFVINRAASEYMRQAHTKSVFALSMCGDGTLLSGGGRDIKSWDSTQNYKLIREKEMPENAGYVRTLVPLGGQSLSHLYVGTTNNLVLEGSLADKFNPVLQGNTSEHITLSCDAREKHFVSACKGNIVCKWDSTSHKQVWRCDAEGHFDELWAITTHQEEYSFVTAGYDQHVAKWNALKHKLLWKVFVEKPCLSVAMDPEGKLVVVGTTVGRFIVLNGFTGQHMASIQAGGEQLDAIRFSPNGQLIAMGSHDCNVYIYEVQDDGQVFRKHKNAILRGHRNFVTHLDWSEDSQYLQSVSGDYDLLFWDISSMRGAEPSDVRDVVWQTQTCVLGHSVLGAWSSLAEGEDINTVHRSAHSNMLAVGDNQGTIKLYKYPCTADRPYAQKHKAYSGHVTNVRFTFDDGFLISCGGVDAGILQWKIVDA